MIEGSLVEGEEKGLLSLAQQDPQAGAELRLTLSVAGSLTSEGRG